MSYAFASLAVGYLSFRKRKKIYIYVLHLVNVASSGEEVELMSQFNILKLG